MNSYHLFKKMRSIRSAARQMKPDDSWVGQTRRTLLMQAKNTLPASAEHRPLRRLKGVSFLIPAISLKWMRAPAFAAIAAIITLFGGSLFSVSAAERSLPGDFLYSVKLATEQARLALTKKPQDKVKLKTEFTERRVQEMKRVIATPSSNRKERVTQATEVLKRDLNTIKQQLDDVKASSSPEEVKEAVKIVDDQTASVVKDLQESKEGLSPDEQAKVNEAQIAATDTSLKAIEVLAEAHSQAADIVTEEEVAGALKTHSEKVKETISKSVGFMGIDPQMGSSTNAINSSTTDVGTNLSASTTIMEVINKVNEAQKSFQEADQLASENKIDEAVQKTKQGTQQALSAQKTVEEAKATDALAEASATAPADGQAKPEPTAGSGAGPSSISTSTPTQ